MKINSMFNRSIAILILSVSILIGCSGSDANSESKIVRSVKSFEVKSTQVIATKVFPGVVKESEETNVAFRISGPIQKIYVKEGAFVKKGDLLAEIDSRDYILQRDAAEAQYDQLAAEYDRIKELYDRKSVAGNDYDKITAGKSMALAKMTLTKNQLADTKLRAPFTGYITASNFEDGEMVKQGTPIFTIIDVSSFDVDIDIPTSLYLKRDQFISFSCTQENIPGSQFSLSLSAANSKANNHGLYKMYLKLTPEEGAAIASGMSVSVSIVYNADQTSSINIPVSSMFNADNKVYVWVIDRSTLNLKRREIKVTDRVKDGMIQVVEGLSSEELIVAGGVDILHDNEHVKLIQKASETNVGNIL